jgi:hypothetical protein
MSKKLLGLIFILGLLAFIVLSRQIIKPAKAAPIGCGECSKASDCGSGYKCQNTCCIYTGGGGGSGATNPTPIPQNEKQPQSTPAPGSTTCGKSNCSNGCCDASGACTACPGGGPNLVYYNVHVYDSKGIERSNNPNCSNYLLTLRTRRHFEPLLRRCSSSPKSHAEKPRFLTEFTPKN